MPQPITHYLVIENSLKEYQWSKQNMNYAAFGSFRPDLFYLKDALYPSALGYSYDEIADLMHWEKTLSLYCRMLDFIKGANDKIKNKLKAFAYGYYSHVITDCIFHPYVYLKSLDHWQKHDVEDNYNMHKRIEAMIDSYLLYQLNATNAYKFQYQKKILCYQSGSKKLLDKDVFNLLNNALEVFKNDVDTKYMGQAFEGWQRNKDYKYYFADYDIHDEEHPIYEAYDDFVDTITELYTFKMFHLIPLQKLKVLLPVDSLKSEEKKLYMNEVNAEWYPGISYSVNDLYDLSVKAVKKVISLSEDFFSLSTPSSKDFFSHSKLSFLKADCNLDTGLDTTQNSNLIGLTTSQFLDKNKVFYNQLKIQLS